MSKAAPQCPYCGDTIEPIDPARVRLSAGVWAHATCNEEYQR